MKIILSPSDATIITDLPDGSIVLEVVKRPAPPMTLRGLDGIWNESRQKAYEERTKRFTDNIDLAVSLLEKKTKYEPTTRYTLSPWLLDRIR